MGDALQDALIAAWRKRNQYDDARETARNWLLAIVADQCRKGHRRRFRRQEQQVIELPLDGPDRRIGPDLDRPLRRLSSWPPQG
jgi:RNA polymerase sigma-70 factor, ECF subfamily